MGVQYVHLRATLGSHSTAAAVALETEDHEFLSNNAGSIYEVRNRREGTPYVYKVSTKGGVRSKAYKSEKYDSDGGEGSRISKLLRASYEYLALRRTSS